MNNKLHPVPYTLALLSADVYEDHQEEGGIYLIDEQYKNYLPDWDIKEIMHEDSSGYYGIIYQNTISRFLVVAHRGTVLQTKSMLQEIFLKDSPVNTDFVGVIKGEITNQESQAIELVYNALNIANRCKYSLTITGHSLGSFLAEVSGYHLIKGGLDRSLKLKIVTFDGPGSLEALDKRRSNVKNRDTLDDHQLIYDYTTSYLSEPNFVNCCNMHVGRVFQVNVEIDRIEFGKKIREMLQEAARNIIWFAEQYCLSYLPANLKGFVSQIGNFASSTIYSGASEVAQHLENALARNTGVDMDLFIRAVSSIEGHHLSKILDAFDSETGYPHPQKIRKVNDWPKLEYAKERTPTSEGLLIYKIPELLKITINALSINKSFFATHSVMFENEREESYQKALQGTSSIIDCDSENRVFSMIHLLSHYDVEEYDMYKDRIRPNESRVDRYLDLIYRATERLLTHRLNNRPEILQAVIELKNKYKILDGVIESSSLLKEEVESLRDQMLLIEAKYLEYNPSKKFITELLDEKNTLDVAETNPPPIFLSSILKGFDTQKMVGRGKDEVNIFKNFADNKILVINGLPGIGKSFLAEKYAKDYFTQRPNRVAISIDATTKESFD
ncbi:MAG: hypothetical protein SFT91_05940, partial [Rickettsiaceae bacterium]|nr:hypothetical protein [Rickettsiaceae bacterium]